MEDELPSFEDEMAGIRARAADARDAARLDPVLAGTGGRAPAGPDVQGAATALANGPAGAAARGLENVVGWVKKLPRNISLGLLDAAKNTLDAANQALDAYGEFKVSPNDAAVQDPTHPGMTFAESKVARQRDDANDYDPARDPDLLYSNWRNTLRTDDDMADAVTQGAAQFMIPFSAWAKAARVGQGSVLLPSLAAEAATSATAFDPHDGRLADLIDLGKHSEGKFGELLRTAVPDGSAQNAYINYMTDRSNETDAEGRFKNVIDNSVASLALAGLLKGSATILKNGKAAIQNAPDVIGNAQLKGSMAKQKGMLDLSLVDSQPRHVPLGNVTDSHTGSVLDGEFVVPGSNVITANVKDKPVGFIAFKEDDSGALQINRVKVADENRGQGLGKKLLLDALDYADKVGRPLVSDNTVTVSQLRVYEALQKAGKIKVTYSDPAAVEAALKAADARVPVKGKGGKPVVTKIERVKE